MHPSIHPCLSTGGSGVARWPRDITPLLLWSVMSWLPLRTREARQEAQCQAARPSVGVCNPCAVIGRRLHGTAVCSQQCMRHLLSCALRFTVLGFAKAVPVGLPAEDSSGHAAPAAGLTEVCPCPAFVQHRPPSFVHTDDVA